LKNDKKIRCLTGCYFHWGWWCRCRTFITFN